jgi:hypothetical protein
MTVNNKSLGIENGSIGADISVEKSSSGLFYIFQKSGTRVYLVLSKNLSQTENDIAATAGIPQIGDVLNGAIVQRVKPKEVERVIHPTTHAAAILWAVTVETDSRIEASQLQADPTDLRPKRKWYTEKENERVEVDLFNQVLETPATEPLNVEMPMVNLILEIERYENYPTNPAAIFQFCGSTNSGTFYGAPIGTVLLDDIQSDEEFIDQQVYIKVRYVFKFRIRWVDGDTAGTIASDTYHTKEFLNQGYLYFKTPTAEEPITFLDAHGHPKKINLTADGQLLPDGADPTFTTWELVPYADFGSLNLEF